jgi:hypothetical protein
MREFSKKRSVTLRLKAEETCAFVREEENIIESPSHVTNVDSKYQREEGERGPIARITESQEKRGRG